MPLNRTSVDDVIRAFKAYKEKGRQSVVTEERKTKEREKAQREQEEKDRQP